MNITRWVAFVSFAVVVGSAAVVLLVLPDDDARELHPGLERLRRLRLLCLAALVVTSLIELVARGQTMTGQGTVAALDAIPLILRRTHFGQVWLLRLGLLCGAFILAWPRSRAALVALTGLVIGVGLTTAVTGHAGDRGDLSLLAGVDWVHIVASGAWTGGLIALVALTARGAELWPPVLLSTVARRFSRLAGWSLLAVVITGGYNTWAEVAPLDALWRTAYGRTLSVKIATVLVVVWLGALCRYAIVARLIGRDRKLGARLVRVGSLAVRGARRPPRASLGPRLFRYVTWEAVLGVLVFGCTALLVDSTPARHAAHAGHRVAAAHGPTRVTMEELHALGGVPRNWLLRLPPGDARHGREVFRKLGCFACHRVSGEDFPPPAAPGPDLSDVGSHHPPAYLLESILDPNAVIIDEPGYVDARGLSTMPDFSARLSVTELIDLVAYLESLSDMPAGGRPPRRGE